MRGAIVLLGLIAGVIDFLLINQQAEGVAHQIYAVCSALFWWVGAYVTARMIEMFTSGKPPAPQPAPKQQASGEFINPKTGEVPEHIKAMRRNRERDKAGGRP